MCQFTRADLATRPWICPPMSDPVLDRTTFPVLIVAGTERRELAGETLRRITVALQGLGHAIVTAVTAADAAALVASDPSFGCIVLDWNIGHDGSARPAEAILTAACARNAALPVFLMVERDDLEKISLPVSELVHEYVLLFEDTPAFVAGRIDYAWRRHTENLLPPFFGQLVRFAGTHEYSWHTPGHAGGTAFRKSQVGKAFYDFYGETLFRTDLSVSVAELGSLLDHSGPVGAAERNAARVFGADASYFVLNGTSTSNQIVAHSCVVAGDVVLADRNCHKSINYALTVTDAVPVYLVPSRNGYGIIGPVPLSQLQPATVADAVTRNEMSLRGRRQRAGIRGHHQLDLRRPVLPRGPGYRRARPQRAADPLRRGMVRLRPLPSAVPAPLRHARPGPGAGADDLRNPVDP